MTVRKWIRSLFAWQDVISTTVWLYQENAITGQRRALRVGSGYQPIWLRWIEKQDDGEPLLGIAPPRAHND